MFEEFTPVCNATYPLYGQDTPTNTARATCERPLGLHMLFPRPSEDSQVSLPEIKICVTALWYHPVESVLRLGQRAHLSLHLHLAARNLGQLNSRKKQSKSHLWQVAGHEEDDTAPYNILAFMDSLSCNHTRTRGRAS